MIRGTSPMGLLDTYQAERHPAAARSIRHTMAQTALLRPEPRVEALRDAIAETMAMEEPRRHVAALISGLDIRYDLGEGHPLLGRRMPDLELAGPEGPRRVFTLLHQAWPALINLGAPGSLDDAARPWLDRVQLLDASYDGPWELPTIGLVEAPAAVLVRPDGHVAWVGTGADAGLAASLSAWFGEPH